MVVFSVHYPHPKHDRYPRWPGTPCVSPFRHSLGPGHPWDWCTRMIGWCPPFALVHVAVSSDAVLCMAGTDARECKWNKWLQETIGLLCYSNAYEKSVISCTKTHEGQEQWWLEATGTPILITGMAGDMAGCALVSSLVSWTSDDDRHERGCLLHISQIPCEIRGTFSSGPFTLQPKKKKKARKNHATYSLFTSLWWWCRWCRHHWHRFISQYWCTGFAWEEAPIADGWREWLALLPFLAWSARSGFWIRTQEPVWVIPSDWRLFVLHLQDSELLLELCELGLKPHDFWVSLH